MGYGKIFESVFSSTVNELALHVRFVWFALLVICDKGGVIDATARSIAGRINVSPEQVEEAISELCKPDPLSRSPEEDGRRLVPIRPTYGWRIVNYEKYRAMKREEDRRNYMRGYQRDYMAKRRAGTKPKNSRKVATALPPDDDFDAAWASYPLKRGKDKARAAFNKSVASPADLERFQKALANYKAELAVETWRRPMDGCRFFKEWPEYVERSPLPPAAKSSLPVFVPREASR